MKTYMSQFYTTVKRAHWVGLCTTWLNSLCLNSFQGFPHDDAVFFYATIPVLFCCPQLPSQHSSVARFIKGSKPCRIPCMSATI